MKAAAIHGNKSQSARERALEGFKRGDVRVLVATDIAARGIDVDNVTHVIQLDLPEVPEQYVHRIGRTARAGASGIAFAFCATEERPLLRDIERAIRMKIDVVADHPFTVQHAGAPPPEERRPPRPRGGRSGGGGGGRRRQAAPAPPSPGPKGAQSPKGTPEPKGPRRPSRGRGRSGPPGRK